MKKNGKLIVISIVGILLIGAFLPAINADSNNDIDGCDKGPSFTSVVPIKKTTFVNFDKETYIDDFAYLASIPSSVFMENGKLYSHPLLYYQDRLEEEDEKYRILDVYDGIHYFMEDWMSYCGRLDDMTLINVPKEKLESDWKAKEYTSIESDDPFYIASEIALNDWSYSDDAVIAVIE